MTDQRSRHHRSRHHRSRPHRTHPLDGSARQDTAHRFWIGSSDDLPEHPVRRQLHGPLRAASLVLVGVLALALVAAAWPSTASDRIAADDQRITAADQVVALASDTGPALESTPQVEAAANPVPATPGAPAAEPVVQTCRLTYEVHAGDYWIRLAEESAAPLAEVLRANGASVATPLHPGQRICLPEGSRIPTPPPSTTTMAPSPSTTPASQAAAAGSGPTTPSPRPVSPPPAAPPSTPAGPPASTETPAEVEAMIRAIWPVELADRAVEIARRESRLRPGVYNGHCCYGVFQIHWRAHRSWLAGHGVSTPQHLLNARTNITMAWQIYQRAGGWGPWGG